MEAVLKFVTWHYKGDYFATVCPQGNRSAVLIHQLSRQQTQNPFTKSKGIVQCVRFHPSKPYFFVATQRHIRIYNLAQQKLQKKLLTGSRWISSIHVHSGGDNIIMGSFDRRVCWFDLDLGTKPYKVLRYHKQAVRATKFHGSIPCLHHVQMMDVSMCFMVWYKMTSYKMLLLFHSRFYGVMMSSMIWEY